MAARGNQTDTRPLRKLYTRANYGQFMNILASPPIGHWMAGWVARWLAADSTWKNCNHCKNRRQPTCIPSHITAKGHHPRRGVGEQASEEGRRGADGWHMKWPANEACWKEEEDEEVKSSAENPFGWPRNRNSSCPRLSPSLRFVFRPSYPPFSYQPRLSVFLDNVVEGEYGWPT